MLAIINKIWFKLKSLLFAENKTMNLILVIVLLFLLLRLPILFTGIDKTTNPEELARGTIAKEIISGPKFNLIDYQIDSYSGGSLIVSIITIPFFLLFGQNLFALQLTPLLIFTLMLVVLFKFCDRFFNRKIALIGCFLFIFSPPLWTLYTFTNFGFFHESVLLTLIALFVFYEIFYENKKRLRYFGFFGIICGFSFFFVYLTIFPTITMLLLWFVFDKKFFLKKSFLVFALGFLIGLSPWLYYGAINNWPGFEILFNGKGFRNEILEVSTIEDIIKKCGRVALLDAPFSLYFKNTIIDGKILGFLYYYLIFASSIGLLIFFNLKSLLKVLISFIPIQKIQGIFRKKKQNKFRQFFSVPEKPSKETFILLYFLVFLILFSVSNLRIGGYPIWWRYLTPLYPFAFISVALLLNKIDFKKYKVIVLGALLLVLCFWFIGNIQFYETNEMGKAFEEEGFGYKFIGKYLGTKINFGEDPAKIVAQAKGMDPDYQHIIFYNMSWSLFSKPKNLNEKTINEKLEVIEVIPKKYKPFYFEYFGQAILQNLRQEKNKKAVEGIELINFRVPKEYKKYAFIGVGKSSLNENLLIEQEIYEKVPQEYLPYFFEGIGMSSIAGSYNRDWSVKLESLNIEYFEEIESQLPDFKENFFKGAGKTLMEIIVASWPQNTEKTIEIVLEFIEKRKENEKEAIIEGMSERIYLLENRRGLKKLINEIGEKHQEKLLNALTEKQKELIE